MIEYRIVCDCCQRIGVVSLNPRAKPHILRFRLAELGWVNGGVGGRDLCPDCKVLMRDENPRVPVSGMPVLYEIK